MVLGQQQRPAVSLAQHALLQQLDHLVGQVEQPQIRLLTATRLRPTRRPTVLARQAELLDQRRARAGLLDRVEVLARHVLDQRHLERRGVRPLGVRAPESLARPAIRAARQRRSPATSS